MLEFRNVSFTYKNSEEKVLNNVSFKINEGECVLLTGISGSGKSTIVHLMNGLIPEDIFLLQTQRVSLYLLWKILEFL